MILLVLKKKNTSKEEKSVQTEENQPQSEKIDDESPSSEKLEKK